MSFTDIFAAAKGGTVDDVRYFVEKKGININVKNNTDWTPSHFAQCNSNVEVLKYLISKGADVNAKTKATEAETDVTPLHAAIFGGKVDFVKVLISAGADVNVKTDDGLTPLHVAAMEGYVEIAKILISSGAKLNETSNAGGTALHEAVKENRVEIATILVSAGADVNFKIGKIPSPLEFAKYIGNAAMIQCLIR
ncbi:MAG: ankyrin repeat domain-containing protein [Fibromonadales bacterium]|nr:ankyrin repeat domain-containing protein [Fibromonadales bacterium]